LSSKPQTPDRAEIGKLVAADRQRRRLILGLARSLADKGRAELTVADVVSAAGVSRRTFYEHFSNLREAVLVSHRATADAVRKVLARECGTGSWEEQVRAGLARLLELAAAEPDLATLLVLDSFNFDRNTMAELLRTRGELATMLRGGRREDGPPEITEEFLVGAVAAVIAARLRAGRAQQLPELHEPLLELIFARYRGLTAAR